MGKNIKLVEKKLCIDNQYTYSDSSDKYQFFLKTLITNIDDNDKTIVVKKSNQIKKVNNNIENINIENILEKLSK